MPDLVKEEGMKEMVMLSHIDVKNGDFLKASAFLDRYPEKIQDVL
jgi:hypothetical protein